jgi:hypothetical protein
LTYPDGSTKTGTLFESANPEKNIDLYGRVKLQ